jgi:hypothetical protein
VNQLAPFILAVAAFALVGGGLGILLARWLDLRAASSDEPDKEPDKEPGDGTD